jgi:NAD(P)-dependent dehydrogenase (short-subunit alcohol dehydrogenase family)
MIGRRLLERTVPARFLRRRRSPWDRLRTLSRDVSPAIWIGVGAGAGALVAARSLAAASRRIRFEGRVALITGGSRGLGLLLARELGAQGARLALLARDEDELAAAGAELCAGGVEVLTLASDLRDRGACGEAVARVVERFGALDLLINNAGVIQVGPVEQMTVEDFEEAMAIHFWAPLHLTLAALPHLAQRGEGRIVNISSIGGLVAVPHMAPYCASKFALTGLSEALRAELASEGVLVTTVCPGLLRTGSFVQARFKGAREREFRWFALASSLPLLTMNGRRAARKILSACRSGRARLILTPQAKLAAIAGRLAPGVTDGALRLAHRLLPHPEGGYAGEATPGWRFASRWAPSLLTRLGDRAAEENLELLGAAGSYRRAQGRSSPPS